MRQTTWIVLNRLCDGALRIEKRLLEMKQASRTRAKLFRYRKDFAEQYEAVFEGAIQREV